MSLPLSQQNRRILPSVAGEKRCQPGHGQHGVVVDDDQDVLVLLLQEVVHNRHRLVAVTTLRVYRERQNLRKLDNLMKPRIQHKFCA